MIIPPLAPPFSEMMFALTLALLLLAPLVIAGIALINAGLGRSRSAAHAMLGCAAILSVSAIAFAVAGAGFTGTPGGVAHSFQMAGKTWDWLGTGSFLLHHFDALSLQAQFAILLEFIAVALAAYIPWGAGADRLRLTAGCAITVVLAVAAFPLLAHWIWSGGWLAQLGTNFALGAGFIDGAGAATVHCLGGLSALAVIWIVGPRKGKFPKEGLATAMPGHNAVYVLFGGLVAFIGWMAWNIAGAILFLHTPPASLTVIAINTLLSAAAALLATSAVTRIRFGKPDASLCVNGWLAGLVVSSACAGIVTPGEAIFTGLVIGIATPLLVEVLELALSIDDPSGAIAVHGAGGLWGLLAVGIFAPQPGQFLAQLVGVATLLGLVMPLIYLLFWLLNRVLPFRADADGERLGMDLYELGGGAYPEFVIHRDESYR
jgi:Amt family ammonium transporter